MSKSENAYFLLSFSDPPEKPLDGYPWKLRTTQNEGVPSQVLRSAIFGAKVLSAVSKISYEIKIFFDYRVGGGVTQNASSPRVLTQISWYLNTMFYVNVRLKDVQG